MFDCFLDKRMGGEHTTRRLACSVLPNRKIVRLGPQQQGPARSTFAIEQAVQELDLWDNSNSHLSGNGCSLSPLTMWLQDASPSGVAEERALSKWLFRSTVC